MVWRLLTWLVLALAQRRVALAGDAEREQAASRLREGYAGGYLTLDEFSRRTGRVLSARSRSQLRRALRGLAGGSLAESVHATVRSAVLVVCTGAYVVFSVALLLVLAVTLLIHGISTTALLVFLVVWLFPTYLLSRLWRGNTR